MSRMRYLRHLDWVILLVGLLSTVYVSLFVTEKNNREDRLRLHYETNFLIRRIQNRMSTYEGSLFELRAFLKNSPDLRRKTIKNYLHDTQIFQRFPGLQGIGYSELFPRARFQQHQKQMQKFLPDYHVFPGGNHDFYSAVIILEPDTVINRRAIGFDMFSEEKRRSAMVKSFRENRPIMCEKTILVQEDKNYSHPAFNIYLPHMDEKNNLLGFVYTPFRAKQLFDAIFADLKLVLDIQIFDGKIAAENLLYDYEEESLDQRLKVVSKITVSGRELYIRTTALPRFERSSSFLKTALVWILGIIATLLIYSIFLFTRRQMQLAREIALEKERLLQKEKEHVTARDDFLSIASHELKTPLTSLKLQAQVMQRAISRNDPAVFTPEKVTALVKQIDTQASRLTRLVDDMLDISRIRTGRLRIQKEKAELTAIIDDVIERLSPEFMKVIGRTPERDYGELIEGTWDRFRIEQVFTNLFTNAIRYGNGKPVTVKTRREGSFVKIFVKDQGIGIAPENIEKIFDRFERAGVSSSVFLGLGLGLFITNQIVKAHGGSIWVESEIDKGSVFIVELPI